MTKKQSVDIECIKYFIPECMRKIEIIDKDIELFLDYSEKGLNKDLIGDYKMDGFNALVQGKRWRGIHVHELFEVGVIEGTMPYITILDGMPKYVVEFLKKEMFRGIDADIIEKVYLEIIEKNK